MATTPKLRFGLFGTGHWAGQVHAAALTAAPEARLVGIWGRDRFRTAAIAAPYGIAAYDDADALIEDVDAVSIALPPDVQVPVAVRAARAGRHLLLEQPLALSASGADELLAAVSNAGVASVVFFASRFVPAVDAERSSRWRGTRGADTVLRLFWSPFTHFGHPLASYRVRALSPFRTSATNSAGTSYAAK